MTHPLLSNPHWRRCGCIFCVCHGPIHESVTDGLCLDCKRGQHWDCIDGRGHEIIGVESKGHICTKCGFKPVD